MGHRGDGGKSCTKRWLIPLNTVTTSLLPVEGKGMVYLGFFLSLRPTSNYITVPR